MKIVGSVALGALVWTAFLATASAHLGDPSACRQAGDLRQCVSRVSPEAHGSITVDTGFDKHATATGGPAGGLPDRN